MPKLTDQRVQELIAAGATDDEILALSQEGEAAPAEGMGMGGMLAGGAAALGAGAFALAAKKYGVGPTVDMLLNGRRQGMLTGLALPKSLAGNLGAGVMSSIERGSMEPLKEMLRLPTNVKNAVAAFKQGASYEGAPISKWAIPGRILGATDEAAQAALQRAGMTAKEATHEMLQTPRQFPDAMNTKLGHYFLPFRRTPVNQGLGALETMSDWGSTGKTAANLASLGTGFATGYETEGLTAPAAGTAFMGRRGLPFAGAALLGKLAKGDTGREAAKTMQGASPISDYSITQGVAGPFTAGPATLKPALWNLLFGRE